MKKLYIAALALFSGMVSAQAQTTRGTWHIGSSFGTSPALSGMNILYSPYNSNVQGGVSNITLQSTPDGGTKQTTKLRSLGISGNMGYFIKDGVMLGLDVGASGTVVGLGEEDKVKISTLSAAPKVRYYFNNTAKVRPFAEASVGLLRSKLDFGDGGLGLGEKITNNGSLWALRGGVGVFLRENIALDVMISYGGAKFNENDAAHTFGIVGGFSVFF